MADATTPDSTSGSAVLAAQSQHEGRDSISFPSPSLPVRSDDYEDDGPEEDLDDDAHALLTEKHRQRSRTNSMQFDFTSNLLLAPSSSSPSTLPWRNSVSGAKGADEKIGISAGIALIVGMQIGSGIFSSPGVVARETGAVGSALLAWVGAGLLSWAGASSFAELGSALPLNGGAQVVSRQLGDDLLEPDNFSRPFLVSRRCIRANAGILLQLYGRYSS